MSTDLVKADKDVVVLRTFSKIYGITDVDSGWLINRAFRISNRISLQ